MHGKWVFTFSGETTFEAVKWRGGGVFSKSLGGGGGPPGLRMDFDLISNDLSNLKSFLKSWTVSFLNPRICVLFFPSSGDLSWKIDKFGGHWQQSPLPNHLSNHIHSLCVCACWQPREIVCVCEGGACVKGSRALTLNTMPKLSRFRGFSWKSMGGQIRILRDIGMGKFGNFGWSRWEDLNSYLGGRNGGR